MNTIIIFLISFYSLFLAHFLQFVHAAPSATVCFGYGEPFTAKAYLEHVMKTSYDTRAVQRYNGKQCVKIPTHFWSEYDGNAVIFFLLENGTEVGRTTVTELFHFANNNEVLMMKKKIYFSWDVRQITISAYLGTGHICTQQTEFDHLTTKSYLEFFPDHWDELQNNTGCDDNALVTFKIYLEMVIGYVELSELRKTTEMSLMVKKRVYFPYFNGRGYGIRALYQNGHENITIFSDQAAQLDRSNNKRYLEIDPDLFAHLNNVWISFYRQRANHPNVLLGSATVSILREVRDIDFSGGVKYFGSLSGGF